MDIPLQAIFSAGGQEAETGFCYTWTMKTTSLALQKEFCGECSLALMRFVGKMKGVESVSPEKGKIVMTFDESVINEQDLLEITRDSIEKLGYRVE